MLGRRSFTFLVAATTAAVSLSGCVQTDRPGSDNSEATINRVLSLTLDAEKLESLHGPDASPWALLDTTFVVRVNGAARKTADLSFEYVDTSGRAVLAPLTQWFAGETLEPGVPVRIPGVNVSSAAVLKDGGDVIASRQATILAPWWEAGGYPVGLRFDPGSSLAYDLETLATADAAFDNVEFGDEAGNFVLDRARLTSRMEASGRVAFSMSEGGGRDPQLGVDVSLDGRFPVRFEAKAHNDTATLEGGLSIADSKASVTGSFSLVVNEKGVPVRGTAGPGRVHVDASFVAWLLGDGDLPAEMKELSCFGKSEADRCEPEEFSSQLPFEQSFEAESQDFPPITEAPDAQIRAALTRFLAEDLRVGDEVRVDVVLDAHEMGGGGEGAPNPARFEAHYLLRVVERGPVTVEAGSFDAFHIQGKTTFRVDVGAMEEDGFRFRGLQVDETLQESDLWLDANDFVVLKYRDDVPVDLGKLLDALLSAVQNDDRSGEAPFKVPRPEDVNVKGTRSFALELSSRAGNVRFSPWGAIALAHAGTGIAGGALFMPMTAVTGGFDGRGPYSEEAVPVAPPHPWMEPGPGPGEQTAGRPRHAPVSLETAELSDVRWRLVVAKSLDFAPESLRLTLSPERAAPYEFQIAGWSVQEQPSAFEGAPTMRFLPEDVDGNGVFGTGDSLRFECVGAPCEGTFHLMLFEVAEGSHHGEEERNLLAYTSATFA